MWKIDNTPPQTYDAPGFSEPGVTGLFYDGPSWQGKPTRVFAWLGMPAPGAVADGQRVPGIVLVHGGGGSAFSRWVRLWNERGFAALAMDTCGHTPDSGSLRRDHHALGGPPGWGAYDKALEPPTEQWGYHAVEAILRGHSLLRAQPGVDPQRIGLTGISWGGVLTAIAAGHDPRFAFAMSVYGCGFLDRSPGLGLDKTDKPHAERWMQLWDPSRHLKDAKMPFFWINGTNDFAFTPPLWQESHRLPRGKKTLSFKLRMPHGHGAAGENPEELRVFAAAQCGLGEPPLARLKKQERKSGWLRAEFEAKVPLKAAELLFTKDAGMPWPERHWQAQPALLSGNLASSAIPLETTACYLNVIDSRGCTNSSEVEFLVQ
ncbi:alpha/beta hydrolase family protein [Armatimonas rosea]|uniref:Dienelactone hydrolase n=1 Tax=Armatimonas rosea TaxID=685828 RepID=A0A7W9W4F9_ARMRO|nr:prolyl oligopeptidase family serine peptidase [Armatimonas rosea]MBB6048468.1 dienelactone hydrolase [Armatimonas rosea]